MHIVRSAFPVVKPDFSSLFVCPEKISRLASEATDRDEEGSDGAAAAAAGGGNSGGYGLGGSEVHRLKLAAPVLSLDFCPPSSSCVAGGGGGLLLAGGMDGSSHLISVRPSGTA